MHVGELQKLLNDLLPDEKSKLEEGAKEVEDKSGVKGEKDKPEDKPEDKFKKESE